MSQGKWARGEPAGAGRQPPQSRGWGTASGEAHRAMGSEDSTSEMQRATSGRCRAGTWALSTIPGPLRRSRGDRVGKVLTNGFALRLRLHAASVLRAGDEGK